MPENEVALVFAARLKELRAAAGLTQKTLHEKSGINLRTLQNLEMGRNAPGWDAVQALADALGVATDAFRQAKKKTRKKSAE